MCLASCVYNSYDRVSSSRGDYYFNSAGGEEGFFSINSNICSLELCFLALTGGANPWVELSKTWQEDRYHNPYYLEWNFEKRLNRQNLDWHELAKSRIYRKSRKKKRKTRRRRSSGEEGFQYLSPQQALTTLIV